MGKKAMLPETKGLMFCILAIRFCTCYNRTRLFEGCRFLLVRER